MEPDTNQDRILRYLYGDVSSAEIDAFENEPAEDQQLREALEHESAFNRLIPPGTSSPMDKYLLEEGRDRLEETLRDHYATPVSGSTNYWRTATFALAAAALLLIGISISQPENEETAERPETLDILSVEFLDGPSSDDRVRISARVISVREIEGDATDPEIQAYLAGAIDLREDVGQRLDILDRLSRIPSDSPVLVALESTLANDPNPGVRLKAVEALAGHTSRPSVRRVMLNALTNDINPGIRVAVIDTLKDATEPDLYGRIQRVASTEQNP